MKVITRKEVLRKIDDEVQRYGETFNKGFPEWSFRLVFPYLMDYEVKELINNYSVPEGPINLSFRNDKTKEYHFIKFCPNKKIKEYFLRRDWIEKLLDFPKTIIDDDQLKGNLVKIANDFLEQEGNGYSVKFHLFHYDHDKKNYIEEFKNHDNFVHLEYYDLEKIILLYREQQNKFDLNNIEKIQVNLPEQRYNTQEKSNAINDKIGSHYTFISLISGDEIYRIRESFGYKLYDKNIRFSLEGSQINKGIISSAIKEADKFYFYNNGITITCKRINPNSKYVVLESPQIINGIQTFESIYKALNLRIKTIRKKTNNQSAKEEAKKEFKKLKVLLRVIQINNGKSDFENQVIIRNNTQNAVEKRDFISNNLEQKELQRIFATYGFFYEIKRGERQIIRKEKHPILNKTLKEFKFSKEIIDLDKFILVSMAFRFQMPSFSDLDINKTFTDNLKYKKIFGTSDKDISNYQVREIILGIVLLKEIEEEIKLLKSILAIIKKRKKTISNVDALLDLINSSSFFSPEFKSRISNKYELQEEKFNNEIKQYEPMLLSKFYLLSTIKSILVECKYHEKLLDSNQITIQQGIIKEWLPRITKKFYELWVIKSKKYKKNKRQHAKFFNDGKLFEKINEYIIDYSSRNSKTIIEDFPLFNKVSENNTEKKITLKSIKDKGIYYIGNNKIEETFSLLAKHLKYIPNDNVYILIKSSWIQFNDDYQSGILSEANQTLIANQIRARLLSYLSSFG